MTRFRTRLARLEGPKKRGIVFYVIDSYGEDGPWIGSAMVDGVTHPRREGESEEDFKNRIEQILNPLQRPKAAPEAG